MIIEIKNTQLPVEIIYNVSTFCDNKTLIDFSSTSKLFRGMLLSSNNLDIIMTSMSKCTVISSIKQKYVIFLLLWLLLVLLFSSSCILLFFVHSDITTTIIITILIITQFFINFNFLLGIIITRTTLRAIQENNTGFIINCLNSANDSCVARITIPINDVIVLWVTPNQLMEQV
jgi:hypothetical protein